MFDERETVDSKIPLKARIDFRLLPMFKNSLFQSSSKKPTQKSADKQNRVVVVGRQLIIHLSSMINFRFCSLALERDAVQGAATGQITESHAKEKL